MSRAVFPAVGLLLLTSASAAAQVKDEIRPPQVDVGLFERVWKTVREEFYDPGFNGVDWDALRVEYRPRVVTAASIAEQAVIINEMLDKLNASHTELLTPKQPRYYHLLDVFCQTNPALARQCQRQFADGRVRYEGIGVFLTRIAGRTFVAGIWAGFPAEKAGLRVGDEILAADRKAFQPVQSFAGKTGVPVRLRVQSSPDAASAREIDVVPVSIQPGEAFLRAEKESVRIETRGGVKIGYIRIWSYASERYHEVLVQETTTGRLKDTEALIVDLRDGLGGADPRYLNLFNQEVPVLRMVRRDGTVLGCDQQWRKPVALLVNGGTTSGKEALAYGFKKHGMGQLVGTRTAGAVLGGQAFAMPGNNLLYLAVADVTVDAERLEGVGVAPNVQVPFALPYCGGQDPQLQRALDLLMNEVRNRP